jgi:hypothetical protein
VWLLEYIWICVEFCVQSRLSVPWNLEAYAFRAVNFGIDALYLVLAMNRCLAVLLDDAGQTFQALFLQKFE